MPLNELIPIVNQLQEAFAPLGIPPIDLPQIAVVGSQSSGKSSVLESLVGYDFLPRGTGICTRRPLILQLMNENVDQDYAQFSHLPRRIYSFDDVKKTIQAETDRVAGTSKGVSSDPIILRVHSKNVVNLTLVDLPGLTKVPVGDQPQNISEVIRGMVKEIIERPNCIILAVTAANQDLANSDGLQIAREVDPQGQRTVGVLTKLDLMDQGTDAREILEGKVYPLYHGYVGVVNRSQKDIDTGKSMKSALQAEKDFFATTNVYSHIASRQGTLYLSKKLNSILEDHIRSCMPEISSRVKVMLRDAQTELLQYGDDDTQTEQQQRALVLNAITRFCQNFHEYMQGNCRHKDQSIMYGPARLRHIFTVEFRQSVQSLDSRDGLSDEDIHTVRRNAVGVHADLFVPNAAFETLVKQLILQLEEPAAACVRTVSEELKQLLRDVLELSKEIGRFDVLREKVWRECMTLLSERTRATGEFVQNLINMEVAYINTDNPEFEKIRTGVYRLMAAHQSMPPKTPEHLSDGPSHLTSNTPKVKDAQKADLREGPAMIQVRDQWKQHYIRVMEKQLEIFVTKADATPIRQVPLDGCLFKLADADDGKIKCVEVSLPKRGFFATAETVAVGFSTYDESNQWLSVFQKGGVIGGSGDGAGSNGATQQLQNSNQGNRVVDSVRLSTDSLAAMTLSNAPYRRTTFMPPAKVQALSEREILEANVLRQLLEHYFKIVRAAVLDAVPKAIMLMMVNAIQDHIQERLMQAIYLCNDDDETFSGLTRESEEVRRRRTDVKQLVAALRRGIAVMREL